MLSILIITTSLGIADPTADAAAALALAKAKRQREQVAKVEPVAPAQSARPASVKVADPLSHVHRCGSCGNEWSHPNTSAGDRSKHTCQKCGVELPRPWWPSERGVRIKAAKVTYRDVVEAIEAGESLTVAVGVESDADCWVESIPETEPGLWRCFLDHGEPKMERVPVPMAIQPMATPAPMVLQNVLTLPGSR